MEALEEKAKSGVCIDVRCAVNREDTFEGVLVMIVRNETLTTSQSEKANKKVAVQSKMAIVK